MVNLSQSLSTCFFEFEKKKDKNSGGGDEYDNQGGDGDNGKDDVAVATGYASANGAIHRNAGAKRERKRVPYHPRKASLANFLTKRRLRLYNGFENKMNEDHENGDGDGNDGNNGGGRDDDKNGGGGGTRGNNKKESKDRESDGNGDKDKHGRDDGGGDTKGKKMDFMGEAGFDYRYGYHAGMKTDIRSDN